MQVPPWCTIGRLCKVSSMVAAYVDSVPVIGDNQPRVIKTKTDLRASVWERKNQVITNGSLVSSLIGNEAVVIEQGAEYGECGTRGRLNFELPLAS